MGSEDEDETVDLSRYWRALRRRWPLVLACFGAMLLLGALWTALQKPVYQSRATLLVITPGAANSNTGIAQFFGGSATSASLGQQMLIISSPGVLRGALLRVSPSQRANLKAFMRPDIAPEPGADAIYVQVQAHDAKLAAVFANAICAEYIHAQNRQNDEQVNQRTSGIKEKLKGANADLDRKSKRVQGFQESRNLADFGAETNAVTTRLAQTRIAASDNDNQRASDEKSLQSVNEQLRSQPEFLPNSIVPSSEAETIKTRIRALKNDLATASGEYTPTSRTIRELNRQISELTAQLNAIPAKQFGSQAPNPLRQNLLQRRSDLQVSIRASLTRAEQLQNDIREAKASKSLLPGRAYNLGRLLDDQSQARSLVTTLQQQLQNLSVQEIARGTTASVISPAEAAPAPISPRKGFNLAASGLLGLLLGTALALLLDRLDDRVHAGEDAEVAAHLPILAHVPLVARGATLLVGQGSGTGARPHPSLVESFRMLRANIAFAGLDEPPRSVAITSCRQGEGKSTSALNLATVVGLSGKSVLLIDCDLRRPEIHSLLGLSNEAGLTTVAAGRTSLESAIQSTGVAGLRVLTSGPIPSNAPELFESRGGRAALSAAMRLADFVVMDCPPALGLADAHAVAALCDATLLVVACEGTNKRQVARACRSLSGAGGRLLGLIFNKTPARRGDNDGYFQSPAFSSPYPAGEGFSFETHEAALSNSLAQPDEKGVARGSDEGRR